MIIATARLAVFAIHPLRNLKALHKLLGEAMVGILCSDRWCVYDEWSLHRRQLCWAHIKRNVEKQCDRGGPGSRAEAWAEGFLDLQCRVFEAWHLFRDGGSQGSRRQFDDRIASLMLETALRLEEGERSRDKKLARFCARLRERQIALWAFATTEGMAYDVEPTNIFCGVKPGISADSAASYPAIHDWRTTRLHPCVWNIGRYDRGFRASGDFVSVPVAGARAMANLRRSIGRGDDGACDFAPAVKSV